MTNMESREPGTWGRKPTVGVGEVWWQLRQGSIRVRVRQNIFYPATFLLSLSRDRVVVRRGDVSAQMGLAGPSVWVGAGSVERMTPAWSGTLSADERLSTANQVIPDSGGPPPAWIADLAFDDERIVPAP